MSSRFAQQDAALVLTHLWLKLAIGSMPEHIIAQNVDHPRPSDIFKHFILPVIALVKIIWPYSIAFASILQGNSFKPIPFYMVSTVFRMAAILAGGVGVGRNKIAELAHEVTITLAQLR